jgi:hypothetical protein
MLAFRITLRDDLLSDKIDAEETNEYTLKQHKRAIKALTFYAQAASSSYYLYGRYCIYDWIVAYLKCI